ncbi:peroxiredoxin-like family protein [Pontibacillus salipaludis]|uniref:thioredoxin-dependent peroxiredoxin n=1 Tax=Pontibacillus salipaludis TaxID=1697394 RepID=A0ABQ1Q582_9BACI|nr:peroxiredoxin-like family protein [Pontibacillus salipaludis]GGD13440.1 alkyl hydroperoxide reductase [Pontibacillus salipaludis]
MLKDELQAVREKFFSKAPEHVTNNVTQATNELIESGMASGLAEDDIAPDFTLENASGEFVTLYDELKKGPVILNFYRGGWCPYCNLELRAYEEILNDIKAEGAQLIAISPQTPDQSLTTREKNNLSYEVVSDPTQEVIKQYNLLFELPDYLVKTYKEDFNIDLNLYNSQDNPWRLPVAGTVVINQDGTIIKSSANVDYMYRTEPREVLMHLKSSK